MPRLELYLLGAPRIERDGKPVTFDTRKATALLAYLAMTRAAHSREAIAALLWQEYDQAHALGALRRTLSTLQKSLQTRATSKKANVDWLDVQRDSLALNLDANVGVDAHAFRNALAETRTHHHAAHEICPRCLKPLTDAVSLYHDNFLAGFTLRDSPAFDEWQFFESENLQREMSGALDKLIRLHTQRQEFEIAIEYARRSLALDPLDEPAHRQLMQLYATTHQRAAALRQYQECARILQKELGVAPLEETTRLFKAIKEQRSEEANEPENRKAEEPLRASAPSRIGSVPLVGRNDEWRALLDAYAQIQTDGRLMVVEGEAGIGKTRLAEEFLEHMRSRGAFVATAHGYEGETNLVYGAFIETLRAAYEAKGNAAWLTSVSNNALSEATRLLPELATRRPHLPPLAPLDDLGARSRFFDAIHQVLVARFKGTPPGVLFFDDAQWLDEASLDLLIFIARRLRAHPFGLLLTWRTEQIPADHPLRQLLADAQRQGIATHLTLARLDRAAVNDLMHATHLDVASSKLSGRVFDESEGLPFFIVEYLAAIRESAQRDDAPDWSLPRGVRDLLRARLASASETGVQLLACASVIGRSFDLDILRAASGRNEEETVNGLDALIARGLVRELRAQDQVLPTYDFTHEKLRALVYEETSLARRRILHRRVANALLERARARHELDAAANAIARHLQLGGEDAPAAEYFKRAGDHARTLYAHADALAYWRAALELRHPDAAEIYESLGEVETWRGQYEAALRAFENASARADKSAQGRLEYKVGAVYLRRGERELAEKHFASALAALGAKRMDEQRARILADWSLSAHSRDDNSRAVELGVRALAHAKRAGNLDALAKVNNLLGILSRAEGKFDRACEYLQASLKYAEESNDSSTRIAALNNLALVNVANGDHEQALDLTRQALALCVTLGDRHREAALHNNLADRLYALGRSEEAMAHLKQAVVIFSEIGDQASEPQPEIWKLFEW